MIQSGDLVRYLAVGRPDKGGREDKHEILGSLLSKKGDPAATEFKEHTIKIMNKAQKMNNSRIRLKSEHGYEVHVQADQVNDVTLIFIAIVSNDFGAHHLPATFCDDFKNTFYNSVSRNEVGASKLSLSSRTTNVLEAIHRKYNSSSLRDVNQKVDQVKNVMRENMDIALQNVEKLDEIDQKAIDIEAGARKFHQNAQKVRCAMCKEYWKATLLIIFIVLAIIGIIVGVVIAKTQ